MFADLILMAGQIVEWPLKLAERELEKLDRFPRVRVKDLPRVLLISSLTLVFAVLYVLLEFGIVGLAPSLEQYHIPLVLVLAFIGASYLHVRHRQLEEKRQLEKSVKEWRGHYDTYRESLVSFTGAYKTLVVEALESGLEQAQNHKLVRELIALGTPPNHELALRIDRLQQELGFASRVSRLRPPIQEVLFRLLDDKILEQEWGQLYITFAVKLQLGPWIESPAKNKFVFIRDYDEVAYLSPGSSADDVLVQFTRLLRSDLESILELVNGKLWSVMYRDVVVWLERDYGKANQALLERARNRGSDLRRLFFYDDQWLSQPNAKQAIMLAAKWHAESQYPCRFVRHSDFPGIGAILRTDNDFVASCLINGTRILMHQTPPPPMLDAAALAPRQRRRNEKTPRRYLYVCDVEEDLVLEYESQFDRVWNDPSAQEPAAFLSSVGQATLENPAA